MDLIIQAGIGSVVEACQTLDVHRTAFYAWQSSDATTQSAAHVFPQIGGVLILTPTYPHFGLKVSANESKRVTSIAMLQMPK